MRTSLLSFICLFLSVAGLAAHEMRPGYLEIQQTAAEQFDVFWKVPAQGTFDRLDLNLVFAADVEITREPVSAFIDGAHIQRLSLQRAGGLINSEIHIKGLERTYTDVLVRVDWMDGSEQVQRITAESPTLTLVGKPSVFEVAWTYFELGVEHILLGIDHLLFVLALLLLVDGWRKLIGTITAFTIAHSITLALATLGFVKMPGAPVEAIIALSIVFVASEIVHGYKGSPGLTARAPWIVAFAFGLLHGFGFAGALSEIGLPQSSIPLALLTFNLGVEVGQLCFVTVILIAIAVGRRVPVNVPQPARLIPPYAIGSVAAFWMIERVLGF